MAEVVPDSDDQVLQNFLTHSSWDHRRVMDQVAGNANELIGASSGAGLYIDESAFQKKGTKPVGLRVNGTASEAVTQTRRLEQKICPDLKGLRWVVLKDRSKLNQAQRDEPPRRALNPSPPAQAHSRNTPE